VEPDDFAHGEPGKPNGLGSGARRFGLGSIRHGKPQSTGSASTETVLV
jgi:hypothetical protein